VELCLRSPNAPSWRGAQLGGAQGQLCMMRSCNFVTVLSIVGTDRLIFMKFGMNNILLSVINNTDIIFAPRLKTKPVLVP